MGFSGKTPRRWCPFRLGRILPFFLGLLALFPIEAWAQRGALVVPHDLTALVDEAATIFRGRVVEARVEPLPGFDHIATVVVTVQVESALKGEAGRTFSFRQYIWDIRDRRNAAGYRKGQHLLLLLTQPSRHGLSSPVGLSQGRFALERDGAGRLFAINGAGNASLFRGLAQRLQARGLELPEGLDRLVADERPRPVLLDQLEQLIRFLAELN